MIIIAFGFLTACSGEWTNYPSYVDQADEPVKVIPKPHSHPIAVGDDLVVNVVGEQELNRTYTVSLNGDILMPFVGPIQVAGYDELQAARLIKKSLDAGYLVNAQVTVQLQKTQEFSVMGEVLSTGRYTYKKELTCLEAIAQAGGFTYRANQNEFDIIRKQKNNGDEHVIKASLSTPIKPGDIIRVRERMF